MTGNTELLAQKHRLLGEAVAATKEKLETLKTGVERRKAILSEKRIVSIGYRSRNRE